MGTVPRTCLIAIVLCVLALRVALWAQPITLEVAPHVALAPATIRVRVQVWPIESDRTLVVMLDGPEYFRQSERALESTRRTYEYRFSNLPPGDYVVLAAIGNLTVRAQAQETVVVLGE